MNTQNEINSRPRWRALLRASVLLAGSVFVFAATLGALAAAIWYGGAR